ncbi:MAG TPA: hypothetical protein VGL40_04320 [Bacillota bacterium]|jgi:hypothetical protein
MKSRSIPIRLAIVALAALLVLTAVAGLDEAAAKSYQEQVDSGHSQWRLDAAQVAATTLEGRMIPGGGGPVHRVPTSAFKQVLNGGALAIFEITDPASPWTKIYLNKPVKQDSTGIWVVVSYDPR